MKYGIVTLTFDDPLYNHFDNIKREYYTRKQIPHTFAYNSTSHKELKYENDINYISPLAGPPGIFTMLDKFIYTINNQPVWKTFDYVIRANSSTFININKIESIIETLPKTKCYAGYYTYPGTASDFVSGTCMIFSKDVVEMIAALPTQHERLGREDDLLIFDYMNRLGVSKTFIPMHWCDNNIIPPIDELYSIIKETPLIRIRNNADRQSIDVSIWSIINYILRADANSNNIF